MKPHEVWEDQDYALLLAMNRFGPAAWVATTSTGSRMCGNGLGDTGRGATWPDAFAELTAKNDARCERMAAEDKRDERRATIMDWALITVGVVASAVMIWKLLWR